MSDTPKVQPDQTTPDPYARLRELIWKLSPLFPTPWEVNTLAGKPNREVFSGDNVVADTGTAGYEDTQLTEDLAKLIAEMRNQIDELLAERDALAGQVERAAELVPSADVTCIDAADILVDTFVRDKRLWPASSDRNELVRRVAMLLSLQRERLKKESYEERDQLKAQLEEARKDTERLNWLGYVKHGFVKGTDFSKWTIESPEEGLRTIRGAIDVAMQDTPPRAEESAAGSVALAGESEGEDRGR